MGKRYFDEFVRLNVDKMSQSIVDMTYNYKETVVPKKHYKEMLEKDIMELSSNDINIEMCLLQPYINMIESMNKENRKYFIKALLITELKIKDTSLEVHSLSRVWDYIEDNKLKTIIDKDLIELFKCYKEQEDMKIIDKKECN